MRNICSSPNYVDGGWKIQLSVRLKGTMAIGRLNLIPRSGLEPTVRFDICESAPFTNFAIKAIYGIFYIYLHMYVYIYINVYIYLFLHICVYINIHAQTYVSDADQTHPAHLAGALIGGYVLSINLMLLQVDMLGSCVQNAGKIMSQKNLPWKPEGCMKIDCLQIC